MSVLDEIIVTTRHDLEQRKRAMPLSELALQGSPARPSFRDALARPGLSIIAEHKRSSPSAGPIRPGSNVSEVARAYEEGGAAAMSVLTEEHRFGGSLDDLREAAAACSLPLLRKDFIIDERQILESVEHGADAILLIVRILPGEQLGRFHSLAVEAGLAALVEVHDEGELERALAVDAGLIGCNNRNLDNFTVDLETTARLAAKATHKFIVAESGLNTGADVQRVRRAGAGAILVGESLLRHPGGIAAKIIELLQ